MLWSRDVFRLDKDSRAVDPSLAPRWAEWVSSLGLEPNELLPDAVIQVDRATNQYALHVSKVRRRENGDHWVDEAQMNLVTEPLIVLIGQFKVWPEANAEKVADAWV